jgi:hypothetical protein
VEHAAGLVNAHIDYTTTISLTASALQTLNVCNSPHVVYEMYMGGKEMRWNDLVRDDLPTSMQRGNWQRRVDWLVVELGSRTPSALKRPFTTTTTALLPKQRASIDFVYSSQSTVKEA